MGQAFWPARRRPLSAGQHPGVFPGGLLRLLCALCLFGLLSWPASSQPEPKQITIYAAQTSYSLPIADRTGTEYVGLAEVLEPIGNVSARLDGKKWKLKFNDREAQFQVGKTKAKVNKADVDLGANFLAENGRGLVPLHTLPAVLQQLLPEHSPNLREASRRLFLDKSELRYSVEFRKAAPSQLVLAFSAPVNPFIATEPGRLRMVFRREPLLPRAGAENANFDDKLLTSLAYSEGNGTAELTVSGTAPLIATFGNDRRTITITTPAQPQVAQQPQPVAPLPATPAVKPAAPAPPKFLVVIDPAHGGDDPGGSLTDKLPEKDVTLAFARHLRKELEARGAAVRLLREGDNTFSVDQRAVMANGATPSLYLVIHAAASGSGVHVITSRLAPAQRAGVLLPWDSAQAAFVAGSRDVATAITTELLKHDLPALPLASSLRPLNYIAAPALALEIALPGSGSVEEIGSAQYQQKLSAAVATAIAGMRGRLPHGEAGR